MTLRDFWPTSEALATCTPLEAESLSDAVLVAVHQPAPLLLSDAPTDEHAVLDALIADSPGVVAVVGPEGAGKTHLLRWLALQMGGNRRVVSLQKGAGVRVALESALAGLEGPAFDALREHLNPAPAAEPQPLTTDELLERFRAALQRRAAEARAACDESMKREGKVDPAQRALAEIHGPGLVALLEGPTKDVLLADTEQPSVFQALARGETEGNEFKPADFEFRTVATNKLTDVKLQRYVQKLKTNTQNERATAAALLNEVRDEVLSQSQPAPAAKETDADRFRRAREELRKEGRDLVLLIDDFDASDESRELLDLLISEGVRTLLTATESPGAGRAFVIEPLEAPVELIGAYLSASRLATEADLADADLATLAAFGTSQSGHHLFPFNAAAIGYLAGGEGNPRKLLANVLHATLSHRDEFLRGAFPPAEFRGFDSSQLGDEVQFWLKENCPDDYERYAALLGIWGGCPQSVGDVALPAEVYTAFGLAPLVAVEPVPEPVAAVPASEPAPTEPEPLPAAPAWSSELPTLVAQHQLLAEHNRDLAAEVLGAFRAAVASVWAAWVRSQTPRVDEAELAAFESHPDHRATVERVRELANELKRAAETPATDPSGFAAVAELAARLRAALAQLPEVPAEVRAFLAAANTPEGAPLSAVTPAVLEWLVARGQSETFRVRR